MKQQISRLLPASMRHGAALRGMALAGLYIVLLMLQLFTYDHFFDVMKGYGLPGGSVSAAVLALALPLLELISLPFLLSMLTPKRLRDLSWRAVVAVPILWLCLALWSITPGGTTDNVGIFGATIPAASGWWFVLFAGLLLWAAILEMRELKQQPHAH